MNDIDIDRRLLLLAPLLSALAVPAAQAGQIDRNETFVLPAPRIAFEPWGSLPPRSGEMAKLYGDFDKPGPYLVMMKSVPWILQRAAQLCHRPDPGGGRGHVVGEQRPRFHAARRRAGGSRRFRQAHRPHAPLRRRAARRARAGRDRRVRHRAGRHTAGRRRQTVMAPSVGAARGHLARAVRAIVRSILPAGAAVLPCRNGCRRFPTGNHLDVCCGAA